MNPLPPKVSRGTLGELLAQLYLLANGVQAAPPIRDSGNDLIACHGRDILALQVKTKKRHCFSKHGMPKLYDGAVFVVLREENGLCDIANPDVYLMSRAEIEAAESFGKEAMLRFRICPHRIDEVFQRRAFQSPEPSRISVTSRAGARSAPAARVAVPLAKEFP